MFTSGGFCVKQSVFGSESDKVGQWYVRVYEVCIVVIKARVYVRQVRGDLISEKVVGQEFRVVISAYRVRESPC